MVVEGNVLLKEVVLAKDDGVRICMCEMQEVGDVLNVAGEDEVDGDDEKMEGGTRIKTAHLMLSGSVPVLDERDKT